MYLIRPFKLAYGTYYLTHKALSINEGGKHCTCHIVLNLKEPSFYFYFYFTFFRFFAVLIKHQSRIKFISLCFYKHIKRS